MIFDPTASRLSEKESGQVRRGILKAKLYKIHILLLVTERLPECQPSPVLGLAGEARWRQRLVISLHPLRSVS